MRFVVLGTSEFALRCASALFDCGCEVGALISIPQEARPLNSADVSGFAERHRIPYYEVEDINSPSSVGMLRGYSPDYIFVSWPKILGKEILEIPKVCCIGTHPTDLPLNRGRHPLHWLIALGIPETKLSFFRMDEGVDTGRILFQISFQVTPNDLISDVVSKMNAAAYEGTRVLCNRLREDPFYAGTQQGHTKANYWRRRTPHDVTLDLRMSSSMVLRTVRSFAPPYPCANLIFEKHVIKVSDASLVNTEMTPEELRRIEPGRVICIEGNKVRVKVDDAMVDLECKDSIPPGLWKTKYIYPPSKYLVEYSDVLAAQLA